MEHVSGRSLGGACQRFTASRILDFELVVMSRAMHQAGPAIGQAEQRDRVPVGLGVVEAAVNSPSR